LKLHLAEALDYLLQSQPGKAENIPMFFVVEKNVENLTWVVWIWWLSMVDGVS